jgi:hypothetical protein
MEVLLKNYWSDRIKEKERLKEANRLAEEKKKNFVPPIYKKIGDPNHPRYGNKLSVYEWFSLDCVHADFKKRTTYLYPKGIDTSSTEWLTVLRSLFSRHARFIASENEDGSVSLELNSEFDEKYFDLHNNMVVSIDRSNIKNESLQKIKHTLRFISSPKMANNIISLLIRNGKKCR